MKLEPEEVAFAQALRRAAPELPEDWHRVGDEGRRAIARARWRHMRQSLGAGGVRAEVAGRVLLGLSMLGFSLLLAPLAWLVWAQRAATAVVPPVPSEAVWTRFASLALLSLPVAVVAAATLAAAAVCSRSGASREG